jgi:hypothetical protein
VSSEFRSELNLSHYGPRKLSLPEFLDSRHMKMIRLSVLDTGRLYPVFPGDIPAAPFC